LKYLNYIIGLLVLSSPIFSQSSLNTTLISAWTDPLNPSVGYNDIWGYADATAGEFAIIGSRTHINFVDINDPANPFSVTTYQGGDNTTWRDIKTYSHYAYTVCDNCNEGMHIFDLSTLPNTATHVNQITSYFNDAHNIYIENGRLYVVGVAESVPNTTIVYDLLIFDIATDPVNPILLASVDLDAVVGNTSNLLYIHDIFVQGNKAYASHGYRGYYIWDVSDPLNVTLIADNKFGGYNHSSWISECGQYAYVAEEVGKGLPMQVVDLTNMSNGIASLGTFIDNLGPVGGTNQYNVTHHNPFVHNDLLYIANYEDGVKIYDIRDPANPNLYGYYDSYPDNDIEGEYKGYFGVWGAYPYLPSGLLLASDRKYGLQVIDVDLFDCNNTVKIIGNEMTSANEKYSCCIISGFNSSISNNVQSKYTAGQYIELSANFEVKLGSQVLFSIEVCEN